MIYQYNKVINVSKFEIELNALSLPSYQGLTISSGIINLHFLNDLTEIQKSSLDLVVLNHSALNMNEIIDAKILEYQTIAPKLLRELYVTNTLAGISVSQSDQMFDDYADVLMRIREGAFPTALRRLQFKRPSGFVTQAIIDNWVAKITSYL